MSGWVSPRLGIKFEMSGTELQLYRPDGERFATYIELAALREQERQDKEQAQQQLEQERQDKEQAQQQLEQEKERCRQRRLALKGSQQLATKLRELGINPDEL